jgi:hypothetical protein
MTLAALLSTSGCGPPAGAGEEGRGPASPASASRIRLREGVSPEAFGRGATATEDLVSTGSVWSDEGLEEKAGLTPAGGTTVHLRGRYRTSVVRRRAGNGSDSSHCVANLPEPGAAD